LLRPSVLPETFPPLLLMDPHGKTIQPLAPILSSEVVMISALLPFPPSDKMRKAFFSSSSFSFHLLSISSSPFCCYLYGAFNHWRSLPERECSRFQYPFPDASNLIACEAFLYRVASFSPLFLIGTVFCEVFKCGILFTFPLFFPSIPFVTTFLQDLLGKASELFGFADWQFF